MTYSYYATYTHYKANLSTDWLTRLTPFLFPSLYDLSIIQITKQQAHKHPLPTTRPTSNPTIDFKLQNPYSNKGNQNSTTKSIQTTTFSNQLHFLNK